MGIRNIKKEEEREDKEQEEHDSGSQDLVRGGQASCGQECQEVARYTAVFKRLVLDLSTTVLKR